MSELFGISMNAIMVALLALLAVALASIAWIVMRHRIMFMMGLRNIPRRPAQTLLIVIGLMLSTLIISAAFSMGDTVNYSLTHEAYDQLYSVDETVMAQTSSTDDSFAAFFSLVSPRPIPQGQSDQYVEAFRRIPGVDGAVGVLRSPVPVTNERAGQSEPIVMLIGVPQAQLDGFPDIVSVNGRNLSLDDLATDEVYVNESAAEDLDIVPGDAVSTFVGGEPRLLHVREIVRDRMLTGVSASMREGMVMGLAEAQSLLDRPEQVDFILVSNEGGVRDSLDRTDEVMRALSAALAGTSWRPNDTKRELVEEANLTSSEMTTIFVLMGLFSIAAGMLLIFLIFVMLAAERKPEMGISRAVGTRRLHLIEMFVAEGMAYNILSALVGAALGVGVSVVLVRVMAALFAAFEVSIVFHVTARSLVISYALGVVLTFMTVTFSSWRVSKLNIVSAIRDTPETGGGRAGRSTAVWSTLGLVAGVLLVALGVMSNAAFFFDSGVTLALVAAAFMGRFARLSRRAAFTAASFLVLVYWILGAGGDIPFTREMTGGWEMFFLSGIAMVASMTVILIYNADLMLGALSLSGTLFTRLGPSMKTAVAYPMANRFRTGMTIAMISLVIFALVVMSTIQSNVNRIFLRDDARGGYDIIVTENPTNPIDDVTAALAAKGFDTTAIAGVDGVRLANPLVGQVRQAAAAGERPADFDSYLIYGMSGAFVRNNRVPLQARAAGFKTDAEVWQSIAENPDYALIDAFSLPTDFGGTGGGTGFIEGIESTDKTFEPVTLQVRDAATGFQRDVRIVGIISTSASQMFFGLYLSDQVFTDVFVRPQSTTHYVRLREGVDADTTAKEIERTLLSQGVQADSLRKIIEDAQALSRGFLYLIQAFMGLGLLVGIAAVGVIAFRTVVERRQQIGVLRAIGYSRGAVALSFVMESSFVTMLGVVSGIALGILLSNRLILGDAFNFGVQIEGFSVPWLDVIVMAVFSFLASLVMTIVPSMRASGVPIAEAMRYE